MKDSQRKALTVISTINDKIKTVSLSGLMVASGSYHHGDASASDAISRMAAPYCNNVPLLHGIGAFGTRVGPTDWGAPRYTYVKKSNITQTLVYPDRDIIPMKDNFDGSDVEPISYLPLIPLVLLNGVSGIAVGWSTDILPHSLNDIIDATISAIDGKKWNPLIPKYDYLNCNVRTLSENSWEFSGRTRIDGNIIWVDELPPDMSLEKFKTKLNDLEEKGFIQTYIDRSTKTINIEIRMKRGLLQGVIDGEKTGKVWTESDCIDFLGLKSKSSQRLVTLDWDGNSVRQFDNTTQLIKEFVEWRLGYYTIRYQKLVDDLTSELNYYQALKTCYDNGLPKKLAGMKNRNAIKDQITSWTKSLQMALTNEQLDRITGLPSYRWAEDGYQMVLDKIQELSLDIQTNSDILNDPTKQRKIYRQEVLALKKLKLTER